MDRQARLDGSLQLVEGLDELLVSVATHALVDHLAGGCTLPCRRHARKGLCAAVTRIGVFAAHGRRRGALRCVEDSAPTRQLVLAAFLHSLRYEIRRDGLTCVDAKLVSVCVETGGMTPLPIHEAFRERFEAIFEPLPAAAATEAG